MFLHLSVILFTGVSVQGVSVRENPRPSDGKERAVRILLECFLVEYHFNYLRTRCFFKVHSVSQQMHWHLHTLDWFNNHEVNGIEGYENRKSSQLMNPYYQLFTVWCVLWSRVCRNFWSGWSRGTNQFRRFDLLEGGKTSLLVKLNIEKKCNFRLIQVRVINNSYQASFDTRKCQRSPLMP